MAECFSREDVEVGPREGSFYTQRGDKRRKKGDIKVSSIRIEEEGLRNERSVKEKKEGGLGKGDTGAQRSVSLGRVFCNQGVDKIRKSFSKNGQESLGNERSVKGKEKKVF